MFPSFATYNGADIRLRHRKMVGDLLLRFTFGRHLTNCADHVWRVFRGAVAFTAQNTFGSALSVMNATRIVRTPIKRNVFPYPMLHNVPNGGWGSGINFSNFAVCHAVLERLTNGGDFSRRKARFVMSRATSRIVAAFLMAIRRVVCTCTQKQVLRIDAQRVIATVTDAKCARIDVVPPPIHHTMGGKFAVANTNAPVPASFSACPFPTAIQTVNYQFRFQPLTDLAAVKVGHWSVRSQGHNVIIAHQRGGCL